MVDISVRNTILLRVTSKSKQNKTLSQLHEEEGIGFSKDEWILVRVKCGVYYQHGWVETNWGGLAPLPH